MKRIRHTSVLRPCPQTSLCLEDNEVVQKKEEKERSLGLGKGHHSLSGGSFARHWDCKSFLKRFRKQIQKYLVTVKIVGSGSLSGLLRWNGDASWWRIVKTESWQWSNHSCCRWWSGDIGDTQWWWWRIYRWHHHHHHHMDDTCLVRFPNCPEVGWGTWLTPALLPFPPLPVPSGKQPSLSSTYTPSLSVHWFEKTRFLNIFIQS